MTTSNEKLNKLNSFCQLLETGKERYTLNSLVLNNEHKAILKGVENYSVAYNYRTSLLHVETWSESHHNGDSYDEHSYKFEPDAQEIEALLSTVTECGIKYIAKIEEQQRQEAERTRLLNKLDQLANLKVAETTLAP